MIAVRWLLGIVLVLVIGVLGWTLPGTTTQLAAWNGQQLAVPGPMPALPWQPGRPELGVQVYWVDVATDTPEEVRRKAQRAFDHVIGMEANAVSISFPFYTDSITSSTVRTDPRTPSPDRVAIVIDQARRSGLRVAVRPLLDEANLVERDNRDWRGRLDPADRSSWFASYQAFLEPYLATAQLHHADTFVIAAELNALQGDPHWAALVARARTLYSGELGYAANWDAYPQASTTMPVGDVGLDAYPRLGLPPDASAAQMLDAWRAWLTRTVPRPGTLLYEVGAAAEPNMMVNPAIPNTPGAALDTGIQQRWFAAACTAAKERGIGGLYWWKIELDTDPVSADPVTDLHDSFVGRPAETAIRQCFAAWSSSP